MKTVLRSLRHTNVVRFTCGKCGHHYEKTAPFMAARFGEWRALEELEKKIVCSKCGNRAGNFISYGNPDR